MPGMPSEPRHDQSADPAAARGLSRAGQVAVVTGGSAGLGLAIATALTQAGSDVVLASRSAERCASAAAQLSARTGRTVRGQACDVTSEQAVAGLIDQVLAGYGRLDVLVTSAGVQARGTLDQLSVATLRACLEVNVVGTWLACRAAAALSAAGTTPVSLSKAKADFKRRLSDVLSCRRYGTTRISWGALTQAA